MKPSRGIVVAVLLVFAPPPVTGEVITTLFADDFEAETPNILSAPLTHWNIAGSIDVLAATNLCGDAGNASICIDLDGTSPPGGSIETKSSFAIGPGTYQLSFDLAGSQRQFGPSSFTETVAVSVENHFNEDFTLLYTDPFQTFTRTFSVAAPDIVSLAFAHQGADQIGLLLDNVILAQIEPGSDDPNPPPAVVPEPWSALLLGLGLACAWWVKLRRTARPGSPH